MSLPFFFEELFLTPLLFGWGAFCGFCGGLLDFFLDFAFASPFGTMRSRFLWRKPRTVMRTSAGCAQNGRQICGPKGENFSSEVVGGSDRKSVV